MNFLNYLCSNRLNGGRKFAGVLLLIVIISLAALSMSACGEKESGDSVRIGSLVGPTGMALIGLEDNDKINIEMFRSPTDAVQKLVSGELDAACLPSNMGALLDAKTQGNVRVLADIVNGGLYIVENGSELGTIADLKGKTVIASGKGGTPEYVLKALLENEGLAVDEDVTVEWLEDHAAVAQKLAGTEGAIGLLPDPMASVIKEKSTSVRTALDLDKEWEKMTGKNLPMGIIVARKDFCDERAEDVDYLLNAVRQSVADVQAESDEIIQKIVDAGIIADSEIAKAVINEDLLVCYSSEDTRDILTDFYNILYKLDPTAVGGSVPGDELYYGI